MRPRLLVALVCCLVACKRPSSPEPSGAAPTKPQAARARLVEHYPVSLDRAAYAGSAACADCHASNHADWAASPHGRAVLPATPRSVLGDFQAPPLAVEGGTVAFIRDGDRYYMETRTTDLTRRHPVDLVIGSGRQHQLYVTHDSDGVRRLLPVLWTTRRRNWMRLSFYQPSSIEQASPSSFEKSSLVDAGCVNCHVSQGGYRLGDKGVEPEWVETPVNCESCHGPAAEHVARRRAGAVGGQLRSLKDIGPEEEARVCGVCHGPRYGYRTSAGADGWPWFVAGTLRDPMLRPDGTQAMTRYQYAGHVLSRCYGGGGLLCSSCHAPHTGRPRALDGQPADGARSDRQCTACHRNYLDVKTALSHGHHRRALRCIDCHMAPSWIGNTPEQDQRTADHSISIPRPQETLDFQTPNACTTCHDKKTPAWALSALGRWGASRALGSRGWVKAIDAGRKHTPRATEQLVGLLADASAGSYLHASALDLLETQSPDPRISADLEPWTRDPDPWVRALAFRALVHNDEAHAESSLERALLDAHPLVRLLLSPLSQGASRMTADGLERHLADALAWCQRPQAADLMNVAGAFSRLGDARRAVQILEMAARSGTPRELRAARFAAMWNELNAQAVSRPPSR